MLSDKTCDLLFSNALFTALAIVGYFWGVTLLISGLRFWGIVAICLGVIFSYLFWRTKKGCPFFTGGNEGA